MLTVEIIKTKIKEIFATAEELKLTGIVIHAGNLHRLLGRYPGDHRMPMCCSAMKQLMQPGDKIINEPKSGQGATLEIMYKAPYAVERK